MYRGHSAAHQIQNKKTLGTFAKAITPVPNDIEGQQPIETFKEEKVSASELELLKIPPWYSKCHLQRNEAGHTEAVSQLSRLLRTRSIFQARNESKRESTLPTFSIHCNVQRCDRGRSAIRMRPLAAVYSTQKKNGTSFLLLPGNSSVVGCTPIVTDGIKIDAELRRHRTAVREISLIRPLNTDQV